MYVFKDGKFLPRPDLKAIVDKAFTEAKGKADDAMRRLGFLRASDYCYEYDTETLSISTFVNFEDIAPLADYDFLIHWMAAGVLYFVAITGAPDYYEFLGKYLPIIKLGGELSFAEDE